MIFIINGTVFKNIEQIAKYTGASKAYARRRVAYYEKEGFPPTWKKVEDETDVTSLLVAVKESTSAVELAHYKKLGDLQADYEGARKRVAREIRKLQDEISSLNGQLESANGYRLNEQENVIDNKWILDYYPVEKLPC